MSTGGGFRKVKLRADGYPSKSQVCNLTTILVVSVALVIITIVALLFGFSLSNSGPRIQGRVGDKGDKGDQGTPGLCNINSTNDTLTVIDINVTGNVLLQTQNASLQFSNGSIEFDDGNNCVRIEPKLCVSEITNDGPASSITVSSNLTVNGALNAPMVVFGPNAYIYYDPVNNTLILVGATLDIILYPPIFIGNSGYLTNVSGLEMLVYGNQLITINSTGLDIYGYVELFKAIISNVDFWQDISIASGRSIFFGNTTTVNGTIPQIFTEIGLPPNTNLTIDGFNYSVVLRSLVDIILNGSLIKMYGNLSVSGNIVSDLYLDDRIIFNGNNAKIYASGPCLVLEAPSLCFNATNAFIFNTPVSFTLPLVGNVTVNGTLTVIGTLNLLGQFTIANLTVFDTFNSYIAYINNIVTNTSFQTTLGSQVFFGGFFTTSAASISNFGGQVKFLSGNVSSVTCALPYFDAVNSGCVSLCTNHSTCTDTFNTLTVRTTLQVQSDIVQNNTMTPHPCCTGIGPFNDIYQQWSGIGPGFNDGYGSGALYPLTFSTNDFPTYSTGQQYIGFSGGSSWTAQSSALYRIGLLAEIDGSSTANMYFLVFCGGNQVFSSPTLFSIMSGGYTFTLSGYGSQSLLTFTHEFHTTLTIGTICQFQIGYQFGNFDVSTGNRMVLSIKLETFT